MKTSLRIDEKIYREAEAAADRAGITVAQFVEETLKLRLPGVERFKKTDPVFLPIYSGGGFHYSPQQLKLLA